MNLSKEQKIERSQQLAQEFKQAGSVFFASYQGLKFQELSELREKLAAAKASFRVERNSVVSFALKNAELTAPDESVVKGPSAIVLQEGDDVAVAAKILSSFAKEKPALKLKACYAMQNWFNADECKRLASLKTRPELLSQLAGTMYLCTSRIASVLQAPIRDLAYVLKAVEDKKKQEDGAAA